jgi:N-acetylglucosamine-6-phosphate deacetylase
MSAATSRTTVGFLDRTSLVARRYDTGEPVRIELSGNGIAAIEPHWPAGGLSKFPWVAPGLFDIQVNGMGGTWFADRQLTAARAAAAISAYVPHGVTRLFPTLITSAHEVLSAGFTAIREACERDPLVNQLVAGCHLEGPFLSKEDGPRGAHPVDQIRPADWDEFCHLQQASGNRIRLVTIAPEVDHALSFIRRAVESGVRVAIGHTAATGDQIAAAVDAGATLSTHLGNGAHPILPRHPNYIWEQLADPRLAASLIVDGQHLPDSVARTIIATKGVSRSILTCDASGWVGCPEGLYENELGHVEVRPGGRIVVAGQDRILAGSGSTTEQCVARAVRAKAASWRDAIDMASANPARLMGFREPRLMRGDPADLFVFSRDEARFSIDVTATLVQGVWRHGPLAVR